jgi:hypothetical protein
MFRIPLRLILRQRRLQSSLAKTYQAISLASVDDLWRKLMDLGDVSWHPVLARTNLPQGLVPKPGLMYQAVTRLIPIPMQIFVEQVCPHELLSVRILMFPGLEEQVTYQVKSTVLGSCVSYSVTLRGWLSPIFWSVMRPHAEAIAAKLAAAAECAALQTMSGPLPKPKLGGWDF